MFASSPSPPLSLLLLLPLLLPPQVLLSEGMRTETMLTPGVGCGAATEIVREEWAGQGGGANSPCSLARKTAESEFATDPLRSPHSLAILPD